MSKVTSPKVVAIIQARMGSSRLPGKMMAELAGKPLLYHIIARAQRIKTAQEIVLATSKRKHDDKLADLARSMRVTCIRGPESNVLERFLIAADKTKADLVIRICGDAPLFDTEFLDRSVSLLVKRDADLVILKDKLPSAHQGASVISKRALLWTYETANDDPLAYEHVTAYAHTHSSLLRTIEVEPSLDLIGDYHLSIDTKDDLEYMRKIYERLYAPGQIISLRDVVSMLRASDI